MGFLDWLGWCVDGLLYGLVAVDCLLVLPECVGSCGLIFLVVRVLVLLVWVVFGLVGGVSSTSSLLVWVIVV